MTQAQALTILKSGKNVFLTGHPGSGKSYTINQFVEHLNDKGIYPAITASTGIASTHIGGVTLHSWAGIGDLIDVMNAGEEVTDWHIESVINKWWVQKKIYVTKVLIIDEVSMIDAIVLDVVDRVCRKVKNGHLPFGGIQVVLVGDLFQLPPVTKNGEEVKFVYKSEAWEKLNLQICYITEQHRQEDMVFLEVLTSMRNGVLMPKHISHLKQRMHFKDHPKTTRLFTHNDDVNVFNTKELKKLDTEQHDFPMDSSGNEKVVAILIKNCLSPQMLKLKVGALVMFTRNNFEEGYVNGTLGEVIGFDEHTKYPTVRIQGGKEEIDTKYEEWSIKEKGEVVATISQIPLRLAWAMSVHKSQGMSLDSAIVDLGKSFEFGQGYVALSRVRSLEGLFLERLNEKALQMHPEIVEKDKEFVAASLTLEKTL